MTMLEDILSVIDNLKKRVNAAINKQRTRQIIIEVFGMALRPQGNNIGRILFHEVTNEEDVDHK